MEKACDDYNVALSVLKIFLAFEVVLCHFWTINIKTGGILGAFQFFKSSAAPVFMIISFYICERYITNFDFSYLKKRTLRLYLPNAFWAFIYFGVLTVGKYFNNDFSCHVSDLFWQLLFGCSRKLNNQMWYSIVLIYLTIVFAVVYKFIKKEDWIFPCFAILISFLLEYVGGINYKLFSWAEFEICFPLGRIVEMIPYAAMGIIISRYNILDKIKKYRYWMMDVSACMLYLLKEEYIVLPNAWGFQYQGIRLFLVSFLLFAIFMLMPWSRFSDKWKRRIISISSKTNGIYYIHMLVGIVLEFLIRKSGLPYQTFYSCVFVYVVSYIVICMMRKIPLHFIKMVS